MKRKNATKKRRHTDLKSRLIINYKLRHFPKNDVDKQFDDVIKKHKTFCR